MVASRTGFGGDAAARGFGPAGLAWSPVGLAGYSGGGMATGFAAAMAGDYAPELPIAGVAMGGVPVNIGKLALDLGSAPHPLFGLGFAAAVGLEREYPGVMSLGRALEPAGFALRDRIAYACTDDIIAAAANRDFTTYFNGGTADVGPEQVAIIHQNSLETYPGVVRAPLYQWAGGTDIVNPHLAQQSAGKYCAAGTPVLFEIVPGADHGTAMLPGAAHAYSYLADRFAGLPAPSNR